MCLRFASMVRAATSAAACARHTQSCAPHAVMNDVRPYGRRRRKDLIFRRTGRNVTMSGWIKIGVEFITALAHQWKGSSYRVGPYLLAGSAGSINIGFQRAPRSPFYCVPSNWVAKW